MATEWFYEKNGEKLGPVSPVRLKELAASGKLEARDLVWKVGMEAWQPAARLRGLFQEGTTPPPLPGSTSDRPFERETVQETSNPTQTPAAKLRAGIFEAASRAARMVRNVAGSDGVQEVLGRAGRAATEVGNKAKDAAQKTKDYANSDEAKEIVSRAKRAASEAGDKARNSARQVKVFATSDEVKGAVAASRRNASEVGAKLSGVAASMLGRLGDRWRRWWTGRNMALASAGVGLLALGLLVMRGGNPTDSQDRRTSSAARNENGTTTVKNGDPSPSDVKTSGTVRNESLSGLAGQNEANDSQRAIQSNLDKQSNFIEISKCLKTLQVFNPDRGNDDWVRYIKFSPDGRLLNLGSEVAPSWSSVWNASGWAPLQSDPERTPLNAVGFFSMDGKLFACRHNNILLIWDVSSTKPQIVEEFEVRAGFRDKNQLLRENVERWTPFGVITCSRQNSRDRVGSNRDFAKSDYSTPIKSRFPYLESLASTPNLWVGNVQQHSNVMQQVASSSTSRSFAVLTNGFPTKAIQEELGDKARDGDSVFLFTGRWSDLPDGPLVRTAFTHGRPNNAKLAFTPNGKHLVLFHREFDQTNKKFLDKAILYDTTTWKESRDIIMKTGGLPESFQSFSRDGKLFATISGDTIEENFVSLWNSSTLRCERTLKCFDGKKLLFTPDGAHFLTGGCDSFISGRAKQTSHINLWKIATGDLVCRVSDRLICSFDISPDGKFLVTGHVNGVAKVWDLSQGQDKTHY